MAIRRKALVGLVRIFFNPLFSLQHTLALCPSSDLDRAETTLPILQKKKQAQRGNVTLRVKQQVSGRIGTRIQVFLLLSLLKHVPKA